MFVLHVDLVVKPGLQQDIEVAYGKVFYPAISRQEGFQASRLLRPVEGETNYRLTIAFTNREFQQQWVATDLHQQVWPEIESRCSGFSVCYFTAV